MEEFKVEYVRKFSYNKEVINIFDVGEFPFRVTNKRNSSNIPFYIGFEGIESIYECLVVDSDIVDLFLEIFSMYTSSNHYVPVTKDKEYFISGELSTMFSLTRHMYANVIGHVETNRKISLDSNNMILLNEEECSEEMKTWFEATYDQFEANVIQHTDICQHEENRIFFHCPNVKNEKEWFSVEINFKDEVVTIIDFMRYRSERRKQNEQKIMKDKCIWISKFFGLLKHKKSGKKLCMEHFNCADVIN